MFKNKSRDAAREEPGDDAPESRPGVNEPAQDPASLAAERDEAVSKANTYLHALADAQNALRRASSNEQEARRQAVMGVVSSVLPVLDHFDMALSHCEADPAGRSILDGVRTIRAELVRALEQHGVTLINPAMNDEFDPVRHSVIMQMAGVGALAGRVAATLQVGYMLGDRVLRPAKVGVAPASETAPTTDPRSANA